MSVPRVASGGPSAALGAAPGNVAVPERKGTFPRAGGAGPTVSAAAPSHAPATGRRGARTRVGLFPAGGGASWNPQTLPGISAPGAELGSRRCGAAPPSRCRGRGTLGAPWRGPRPGRD